MAAYSEDDILGALDDAQDGITWPDFEHLDYDILAARLSAYRDEERWAIIFSMIQWDPSSDTGLVVMVEPVGNCIELPDEEEFLACRLEIAELEIDPADHELESLGYVSSLRIRDKKITAPTLNIVRDPDVIREDAFWVAQAAVEKHKAEIMPSDEELARYFPEGSPPKFLELNEWHHSQWGLASEWEVFQLLAKAMVKGDPTLYQPTAEPNTDWRNWMDK